jgi:hypothetical protein
MRNMDWSEFERQVKTIASFLWQRQVTSETINGVKVDCVIKMEPDHWIITETTQEQTLEKLRTDLAKFQSIRPYLMSIDIYPECYFVTQNQPNPSLVETGKGNHIKVLSFKDYCSLFFNYEMYKNRRTSKKFGSAIDFRSGDSDIRKYIPVKYQGLTQEKQFSIDDIADALKKKKRIILLGNYGTGKSRCVQELFNIMSNNNNNIFYPIAINLREHWGAKKGTELIIRHFNELGLDHYSQSIIRILDKDSICFLLDGFDEIGSQAWSNDPKQLEKIRATSLSGVKDLIQNFKGGLIISGREHYFNSENEMFNCLGLDIEKTMLISCADEFSDEEMKAYISEIKSDIELPSWIPRRPLVCQILIDMDKVVLDGLLKEESGESNFWNKLIFALCEREANIHPALDAITIKHVLTKLARLTRFKINNVGPISISEINKAFEQEMGYPPGDESSVMLQRLPALGRLSSETSDRQFIDEYILDGLRAEDVIEVVEKQDSIVLNEKWINPLRRFGVTLLSQEMISNPNLQLYLKYLKQSSSSFYNKILAGDILSSYLLEIDSQVSFDNIHLSDTHINFLDFSYKKISNLHLIQSIIEEIDITECHAFETSVSNCFFKQVFGVSAAKGLPDWIKEGENIIEKYEAVNTVSRIKKANLTNNQRIFVAMVKKLFFQPGSGRKEAALLRGFGDSVNNKIATKILNHLITEKIVNRIKGKEGSVYIPNRKYTNRIDRIITELSNSQDPLWIYVNRV